MTFYIFNWAYDLKFMISLMNLSIHTHRSNVGKSKCAPSKVSGAELTHSTKILEAVQFSSNLKYGADLNILHIRDNQTLLSIHCYSNVMRSLRKKTTMKNFSSDWQWFKRYTLKNIFRILFDKNNFLLIGIQISCVLSAGVLNVTDFLQDVWRYVPTLTRVYAKEITVELYRDTQAVRHRLFMNLRKYKQKFYW